MTQLVSAALVVMSLMLTGYFAIAAWQASATDPAINSAFDAMQQ